MLSTEADPFTCYSEVLNNNRPLMSHTTTWSILQPEFPIKTQLEIIDPSVWLARMGCSYVSRTWAGNRPDEFGD